jgi:hypothetical protein
LSKTASVRNPYTYFVVAVEHVEPARLRDQFAARVEFSRRGTPPLEVGTRVEVTTDAEPSVPSGRRGAAELKILGAAGE